MSISVRINVATQLEWKSIINAVVRKCAGEIVACPGGEFVIFAIKGKSLGGVEVWLEDNCYRVTTPELTLCCDYHLLKEVIAVIKDLSGGEVFFDEDGLSAMDFNDEWIARQRLSSLQTIVSQVKASGKTVKISGALMPVTIGPWILEKYGLLNAEECTDTTVQEMLEYLKDSCWELCRMRHAKRDMISGEGESEDDELLLAMIDLRNGKVEPFDFIGLCDFVAIRDYDNDEYYAVPIERFHKVVCPNHFKRIDDCCYKLTQPLSPNEFQRIKDVMSIYSVDDFFKQVMYPGQGYDAEQRTFILMWNPEISNMKLETHNSSVPKLLVRDFNWNVWDYKSLRIGDRFFMVRCGEGKTGIVMSGVFASYAYENIVVSGSGQKVCYAAMHPNVILNPEKAPLVSIAQLQEAIPSFEWTGGHSGRLLNNEEAQALERLWAEYIDCSKDNVDEKSLNMIEWLCEPKTSENE